MQVAGQSHLTPYFQRYDVQYKNIPDTAEAPNVGDVPGPRNRVGVRVRSGPDPPQAYAALLANLNDSFTSYLDSTWCHGPITRLGRN